MPELPEVETVRRRLLPYLEGRTLESVRISDYRLTQPVPTGDVAARLTGDRIVSLGRRGKYLLVDLASAGTLVIHLRMTGNLLWQRIAAEVPFTRAEVKLDDGSHLLFTDTRRFGTWLVVEGDLDAHFAGRLGPEPLGKWTVGELQTALRGRAAPIKSALLDQRTVAGVGNIYADEALFRAGVNPRTQARKLGRIRLERLHEAIRDVLSEGIAAQGASIRDFRTPDGGYGSAQERFLVYGRGGEPCERCGNELRRTVIGQRGTIFCVRCQRA